MEYVEKNMPNVDRQFIENFLRWMRLVIGTHEGCDDWENVTTHTCYKELDGHPQMSWHAHGYRTFIDLLMVRFLRRPKPVLLSRLLTKAYVGGHIETRAQRRNLEGAITNSRIPIGKKVTARFLRFLFIYQESSFLPTPFS